VPEKNGVWIILATLTVQFTLCGFFYCKNQGDMLYFNQKKTTKRFKKVKDMNGKKKNGKKILQKLLPSLMSLFMGAVCGVFISLYALNPDAEKNNSERLFDFAILFVGMYAAMFVQIIIHEAGHLVFGLISGYSFSSFRILSFTLIKTDGKIKFRRMKVPGTAGQCLMVPPDPVDGKIPAVLYNFGGSLMNLFSAFVFAGLYFVFSGIPAVLMLIFAVVGFVFAVMNGVPIRAQLTNNDGVNALEIIREPEAMHSFWVQLKVVEQISKGIRLKDMPDEWFVLPADTAMKNSMTSVKAVLACNRFIDAKDLERAREAIRHIIDTQSGIIELHRRLLICDLIFIEIINGACTKDIYGLLDKKQKKFIGKMKNNPSVMRTQYFYALMCEKDSKKAEKIKKRFDLVCKIYPYNSEMEIEKEFMSAEFINTVCNMFKGK